MKLVFKYLLYPYSIFLLIVSFIILIVPISFLVAPLKSWNTRLKLTSPFWELYGKIIVYFVCLCRNYTEDHRPEAERKMHNPPGLYIANHQSFLDIPLVLCSFQVPPIMKKEILYIPIFGLCGYSSSAMIVDRKKGESRRKVFEQAKERLTTFACNLQYYPEGTRQKEDAPPRSVDKIKKPLMVFAYENNIPVYPVSIYGTRKVLNSIAAINYGSRVGKIMHSPVRPENFNSSEEFVNTAWNKVIEGYHQLEAKLN